MDPQLRGLGFIGEEQTIMAERNRA